jgi:Putative DNA-binding domain
MSDISSLAKQQNALLTAIFTPKYIATKSINTPAIPISSILNRGLQTYQANASASALRSLQTAYPVIAQLVGDETFALLARDFWTQHPPTRGDLAQWGGDLPVFIASISALQTEPYLSDVAKVEWALHMAATATDKTTDLTTFSLLTEQDPDALTLQLAPGAALVHSHYPIASILTAHLYASPSFEEVGQKLQQKLPEIALVWRQGLLPKVALCTAADAAFVGQLVAGKSLLTALDVATAEESDKFDFNAWLPIAVQNGLLLGAQLL